MKTVNSNRTKSLTLTEKETVVMNLIAQTKGGVERLASGEEEADEYVLDEVYALSEKGEKPMTSRSVKAVIGSLTKKGLLDAYGQDCYYDGKVTKEGIDYLTTITNVSSENKSQETKMEKNEMIDERIVRLNEIKATKLASVSKTKRIVLKAAKPAAQCLIENWDNEDSLRLFIQDKENEVNIYEVWCIAKSRYDQLVVKREREEKAAEAAKAAASKPKTEKTSKPQEQKKPMASKHKVGEHHPTQPWVWTEYKPGKFDWRIDPAVNKRLNKTQEPKPSKKAVKAAEAKPKEKERIGIDEWLAKGAIVGNKKLSDTQKKILKAIKRGAKITEDKKFLVLPDMTLKAVDFNAVKALFSALGYIPTGLEK